MPRATRQRTSGEGRRPDRYVPPAQINTTTLSELLRLVGRLGPVTAQLDLLKQGETTTAKDQSVFYAGDLTLLKMPAVSVVGTRDVSELGRQRAERIARELAASGVLVVSGLAKGVDRIAHESAIHAKGRTVAVIGTPLNKAYPAEHARLQESIYEQHLLLSPFAVGDTVFKSNFPERNRVMAAITDATVIVEASDTSGTLHQASECQKLGRWLFILRSVVENPDVTWPQRFLVGKTTAVVDRTEDIVSKIARP